VLTLLAFIFVVGVLVVVHELGHFTVAKLSGIRVLEFAVGMGPRLVGLKQGETDYSLRLFPIGGYVRMAGMEPGAAPDPRNFNARPMSARLATVLAGPFVNLLFALVVFAVVMGVHGTATPNPKPVVGQVVAGYPAARAGIRPGDVILAIDRHPIRSWNAIVGALAGKAGQAVEVEFRTPTGAVRTVTLRPRPDPSEGNRPVMGVVQEVLYQRLSPLGAVESGLGQTFQLTSLIVGSLTNAVARGHAPPLQGVVGIAGMAGQAARAGWADLMAFTAVLSVNLAIFNLIPFPPLDGARLVFLGMEAVRGRPVQPEQEGIVNFIGFVLLMILAVVLAYHDLQRLHSG
jgi:regulator of sigma E protease